MSEVQITQPRTEIQNDKPLGLSWRDAFTTLFAALVGVAMFAKIQEYSWVFLGTWRTAIGSIAVLGLLSALYEGSDFTHFNTWSAVEWLLAIAAIGIGITGLIVNTKVWVILLAAAVLTLWATSIIRHIFGRSAAASH